VAERTLGIIGEHCKDLEVLELGGDFPSAQTSDMLYLTRLVDLQILKVTYNPKLSDEFLINLAQRCQQLVCLDITGKSLANLTQSRANSSVYPYVAYATYVFPHISSDQWIIALSNRLPQRDR